ncbi:hypothetical protein [Ralstonia phage RP31]|uniref:Transmembrane protein n=2 Tax=Ripduovirus RP12 TaxID=2560700 RepID=A0A1L7N191_9CAUD|nr:membrane protein [Ralstonia phage RP12]BAW19247.1 hypothetical protein [Ralstonia phage RP12]BAW19533.1 hypothetical protein [Ralstonia phage RP31]
MSIWKWVGLAYLGLSLVFTLYLLGVMISEDIRMYREPWRKNTSKFGYNLKWGGIGWWFLIATLPGFNLVLISIPILNRELFRFIKERMKKHGNRKTDRSST